MDEVELLKRFTDCVYFLASPLTCKKGIECEYRHSEIARLNPRDCWYWLGGGCFDPACAFRHPPLEGFKEALSESAVPQHDPALPVKTNVSCYFYLNGFCNKGDRCSFLHGPVDGIHAWKSSSADSTVNNAVPSEKKLSARSNTGLTSIERHPGPSETARIDHAHMESKPSQNAQQLASKSAKRSDSPDTSAAQSEENVVRYTLLPAEGFVQSESELFTDQSLDEQVDGRVEREEWLESSPGFDVLVEGESENIGYEDADHLPAHDEEVRKLNVHYLEYNCEDPIKYDPAYPELRNPLKPEKYDAHDHFDGKQACDYLSKITGKTRESIFRRLSFQKRSFLQTEPVFDGHRGPDLRECLKKRKIVDDHFKGRFSKRQDSLRQVDFLIQGSPRRHLSRCEYSVGPKGRFRNAAHANRSRKHVLEKRPAKSHFLPSDVSRSRKTALLQKRRSQKESASFSGPKTLEQIKEEKKKAQQSGDLCSILGAFK